MVNPGIDLAGLASWILQIIVAVFAGLGKR
jgi:hypothetical protein